MAVSTRQPADRLLVRHAFPQEIFHHADAGENAGFGFGVIGGGSIFAQMLKIPLEGLPRGLHGSIFLPARKIAPNANRSWDDVD